VKGENQDNKVWCCLFPGNKQVLINASTSHKTKTMSGLLRSWLFVVCQLIKNDITPEWMISNLDEITELRNKDSD
jgi:hypothetical protein